MPRDGTLHEPADVTTAENPALIKAATEAKTPKTAFDGPYDEHQNAHLVCLTVSGQLTDGEQEQVVAYMRHFTKTAPQQFEVIRRSSDTTAIRWWRGYGIGLTFLMSNDGKQLMITDPVRTRPFDAAHTTMIVDLFHRWRHEYGSPVSRAINSVFRQAATAALYYI